MTRSWMSILVQRAVGVPWSKHILIIITFRKGWAITYFVLLLYRCVCGAALFVYACLLLIEVEAPRGALVIAHTSVRPR